MNPNRLTGFLLALFSFFTITGKTDTFHIDGYVITESNYHPVPNQIVEIKNETGTTLAWYVTNPQGLYSGNFETGTALLPEISVELSKTCDGEVIVYTQTLLLDNPYLVCNFLVCDFRSCQANFNIAQISGNDLSFQFTDISAGNINSWFWEFGDQNTSNQQHPVHQYNTPDHYVVKLTVTSDSCIDEQHKGLFAFPTICLAIFSSEQVNQGNNLFVRFHDESQGNYDQREWEFGDGGVTNQPDPLHQYDVPGEYEVSLHIWGGECSHSTKKIITVDPASTCYALFTSHQNHAGFYEIQFSDTSMGLRDSWQWIFGDGTTDTIQNPIHVYENQGDYEVVLTINGQDGSSTFTRMLHILQSSACVPGFSYYQNSMEEPLVAFENLSTGEYLEFLWYFGDGTTSQDSSPVHLYPAAGVYDVMLMATGFGCMDSVTNQVEVLEPMPCHAAFSFTSQSPESLEVVFSNESIGIINSYLWDFGDGNFSIEENPVHLYLQSGDYIVQLSIDAIGCFDSIQHLVQIAEPEHCQAAFSIVQEYPQNPLISFVNESVGDQLTSHWDFGDGTSVEETNPQHEYALPGQYTVLLLIATIGNCTDTISHLVEILPPYTLSGAVMAGSSLLGFGDVYLFKSNTPEGWAFYDHATLGTGYFTFSGLTPGSYLVQAIPDFDFSFPVIPNYFPTYNDGKSHWAEAQVLTTGNLPENLLINLLFYNDFFDGKATIDGVVNLLPDNDNIPLVISITAVTGEMFDFRIPDASGAFSFHEIPYGIYHLYPEKAGKTGQAMVVEVSETKPENHNVVFIETTSAVYPDLTTIETTEKTRIAVSPNPAGDEIYLQFSETCFGCETSHISILTTGGTITGKYLFEGNYHKIDVSGLVPGIYFLKIDLENESFYRKLIIQR